MVMKKDGRKRDIKSKLVAAVCMLLVSCIMMVSSTYAWFTLSTAPEVTGITTAVGANGNLEMALMPGMKDANSAYATIAEAMAAIGNATGSLSTLQANTTWGNLVDLSDDSYGLDKITLYPSTMEPTAEGNLPTYYLGTPKYGADGRFSGLNYTASAAIHNAGAFGTAGFGVRAVGTSSGMSAQELAYRSALAAANNAADRALAAAKSAVSTGGSKLASLAVNKATGTTAFDAAEKVALLDAYAAIENAVTSIETALKNYIIADYLSSSAVTADTFAAKQAEMEGKTLAELKTYTAVNSTMAGYIDTLNTLKSTVTTNKTGLNNVSANADGKYEWDDIDEYVKALADVDAMLLNGETLGHWMTKENGNFVNLGTLVSYVTSGTELVLTVNAGGTGDNGIFAKLADFVDTFSTPATISGISYQGISADNLKVTMTVTKNASVATAYLVSSKSEAVNYDSTIFANGGATSLSDFYGYILDMAFRTNAADSYLQLQTEGVDRIYADSSSNPTTMGGGSYISYTIPAGSDYSTEKLVNLMSYIRVVFFDPANANKILGYARLDSATQQISGDATSGYTVKMQLKMWDVNIDAGNDGTKEGGWAANQQIVQLIQNEAKAVSTMVYLDGATLTNADVANVNLTGTMNIQFSSSAKLNPMEYGDLRNPNNNAGTTTPATPAVTEVKVDTANSTQNYTYKATAATVGNAQGISVVITDANGDAVTEGTVTIAGATATYNTETSSWLATYTGTIDSSTTVIITVA